MTGPAEAVVLAGPAPDHTSGSETVKVRREKGRVSAEVGEQLHLDFAPGHAQILTSGQAPRDEVVGTGTAA